MSTVLQRRRSAFRQVQPAAWLPVFVLPVVVTILTAPWHEAARMWVLAISIFVGLKWLTFASAFPGEHISPWRMAGYLFLWPGLNANQFLYGDQAARATLREWLAAAAKTAAGAIILMVGAPNAQALHPLFAGWLGMLGLVLLLHFGVFHLLSLAWRSAGIVAPPLMNQPLAARSLSDFWSRRWNTAFRDIAHRFVLRPLVPRLGLAGATFAVFLLSGLIHDLVISLPVGAGGGGPTVYFLLQGIGVWIERSLLGNRLDFGNSCRGRFFAAAFVLLPVGLLFHPPFVLKAVLPTLSALGLTS